MLWVLLFTLIFGGSESALINAKSKKHIKKHVANKEVRNEVLHLIKSYEKEAKSFSKVKKKRKKELAQLNEDRSTSRDQFKALFSGYMDSKKKLDQSAISNSFKARQLISDSEWQNILVDAVADYEKNKKKRQKRTAKLKKSMAKVHRAVEKSINEGKRRSQVKQIVDKFELSMVEIQKNYNQINFQDNEVLRNRNSTKEELVQLQRSMNNLWRELFDLYTSTRTEIAELASDREWKTIQKALNKIF